jgi:CelD/BcsL family acetyltransferase involved in cellulose biosynthesis
MFTTCRELGPLVEDWERLAQDAASPFLTHAWLSSWWGAFGSGEPLWALLRERDGSLRAGAFLHRTRGRLAASANVHSGDWDVLARDERSREELWSQIAALRVGHVHLQAMPEGAVGTRAACDALRGAGYRVLCVPGPFCPWLALPASFEELMSSVSGSLRQQVGRRRRGLERAGSMEFRSVTGGPTLETDLDGFLALEAAGWKGTAGTAILSRPSTERLYRDFAAAAAAAGWLRLGLLELDGALVAASYDCAFQGAAFLLKTTFSESHGQLSPGLVLLAEVLRALTEEGVQSYDFLGDADTYKTRWTAERHPRVQVFAYRGSALGGYHYRKRLRPLLKQVLGRVRLSVRHGG